MSVLMLFSTSLILSCALLGCAVGFLAGLLGIGGGLIIVPMLSAILIGFSILPAEQVIVVAIATSLASILFTSTSSALAHHRNNNIPWHIAPWVMSGVAMGALISGFLTTLIPALVIKWIFLVCVVLIAINMVISSKRGDNAKQRALPGGPFISVITSIMGALSAMIGIGGGVLIVPLLCFFSVDMRKAIGCATVSGIVIALFGSIGYIVSGSEKLSLQQGFAGYVYLPALFGIVLTSWFTAPLGAKATQYLPVATIKKVFAFILVVIAGKMLFY
ncbi:permease [Pseudoalteromonas luteoviolacea]|uniref:Probable membrane transporter protein n=2 Tax=Pseudoalteromonas luteoviolacea TaxID=43657 RepID=A0A167APT3_9GAMM|nr:sulfite exporter TauE/SafE family protein [Pseudoalteromonas luteoviolacea]KZN45654.1 permease [Pseudoalteromonas luteoviolacea NCIMB 1942]KZX00461.1 permease [Pseudoalteromonas luteoviolacea]